MEKFSEKTVFDLKRQECPSPQVLIKWAFAAVLKYFIEFFTQVSLLQVTRYLHGFGVLIGDEDKVGSLFTSSWNLIFGVRFLLITNFGGNMKRLLFAITVLTCTNLFASTVDMTNLQFPSESGWAIAMTEKACDVNLPASSVGRITEVEGGVVYLVESVDGDLLAKAFAKSTSIFAKKECL